MATFFEGVDQAGGFEFPLGAITIWGGAIADMPAGFHLCDGTGGTPDLTDRFVIHADADAAGTLNVGDSGGAKTHILSEAEMPTHSHTLTAHNGGSSGNPGWDNTLHNTNPAGVATDSKGSNTAHTNRDLYYALAFIQRLS